MRKNIYHHLAVVAAASIAIAGQVGCSDGLTTGNFATIGVRVDNRPFDPAERIVFAQAVQLPVAKPIAVENVGTKNLTVTSIDWAVDEVTGAKLKNKYIDIDFLGGVDRDTFPLEITPDPLDAFNFEVVYTPPLGVAIDDKSDSVLVIKSNARDETGDNAMPELRLTIGFNINVAAPRVSPDKFTFQSANPQRPEKQDFQIYNDRDTATASFHVLDVRLENPNPEFQLQNVPSAGAEVLAPGDPSYHPLIFSVIYAPTDGTPDTNAIIVETDVEGAVVRVPLDSKSTTGGYELSFDRPDKQFDFSNVTQSEKRNVIILSTGPAAITLRAPVISPDEAKADYAVTAWTPATQQGEADTAATFPKVLPMGKSVRLEVEYKPTAGQEAANGLLTVPIDGMQAIAIDLFGGKPKSKIVLAPVTGNVTASGSVTAGDSGTRDVVVYNEGNGPLEVAGIRVIRFGDTIGRVWGAAAAVPAFTVQPQGLRVIQVKYDLSKIESPTGTETETLYVDYHDDFLDKSESVTMALIGSEAKGNSNPTADLAGPTTGKAGDPLTLSAAGSTATSGSLVDDPYVWFVTAKPAGSKLKLNTEGIASVTVTPDVAGTYTFELLVYATTDDESLYLYSDPATHTVEVSAP